MNKAFTIIELIFVIVIISILAIVSIPRLSATYDDAKIAIALNNIGTLVNDLSTFYTSKKQYSSNLEEMTNIINVNYTTPWNTITEKGKLILYTIDNSSHLEECVLFEISNREGNLTISSILNPSGDICKGVQSNLIYQSLLGTKLIGGNRVKF